MKLKVYHNSRCRKSREAVEYLNTKGIDLDIIEYLKAPVSLKELKGLIQLLKIKPIELVRKNETIWKENYKGKTLTDSEVIDALLEHPKLIERPIVSSVTKAVIGRQIDNLIEFVNSIKP